MSTYWYFECHEHTPPIRSDDEISQHTDDAAFRRAIDLVLSRPIPRDWWDHQAGYFENNALRFLVAHPKCRIGMVNEYGGLYTKAYEWGTADDSRLLSHQITEVLGSDDWLVIHDGRHLLNGDDLDARELKKEE